MKRYLKYLLTGVLFCLTIAIIFWREKISYTEILALFKKINPLYFLLLLILQAITYIGDGWLSKVILETAGFKISLKNTVKIAITDTVATHIMPLMGGSVMAYYLYKKFNVSAAARLFLSGAFTFFLWTTYLFFFLTAILFFPHLPLLNFSTPKILFILIIILLTGLVVYFFQTKKGRKILAFPLKMFKIKPERMEKFFQEFKTIFTFFHRQPSQIIKAFAAAFILYWGDVITLYFSFMAFGYRPHLAIVIIGLTLSFILPLLTLIPETPGLVEASLVLVFTALGLPSHIVLLSAILFRLFSYWLPLFPGIISFWQLKKIKV
jgi:uncharacterized protein (TIRG00374 family)